MDSKTYFAIHFLNTIYKNSKLAIRISIALMFFNFAAQNQTIRCLKLLPCPKRLRLLFMQLF